MLQTVSRLLPELPLLIMVAVATHLVMLFAQTLMHYKLGHHPMGLFRNHINFHHAAAAAASPATGSNEVLWARIKIHVESGARRGWDGWYRESRGAPARCRWRELG